MQRFLAALALCALATACAPARAARAPAGASAPADVFPAIPEVRAVRGVARVELYAVIDPATGYPAFSWQAHLGTAPTIRVHPGDAIDMIVHDDMRPFGGRPSDINVHFHGLTVSPHAPADDAMMTIAHPGETLRYHVPIPRTHPPGLYWYHPHAHGESYYDVTNGMSGAIVVEGIERRIPALASMRERIVVLRDVPAGATFPDDDAPRSAPAPGTSTATSGNPCRAESGLQPTLNRQTLAHIAIRPGERQFFRVVNAAGARPFDLAVDGASLDLVALDGVPLAARPGGAAALRVAHVLLPPAGRAEFVLRAPAGPTMLRSRCVDTGSAGDAAPAVALARLDDPGRTPDAGSAAARATTPPVDTTFALGAARALPRLPAPAAHRIVRFTEDRRGFYINGTAYAMGAPPMFVARSGTLEAWTIENATDEVHAFHIHQVHFLVASDAGDRGPLAWRDTIDVPPRRRAAGGRVVAGQTRLLLDFRDPVVRGTFLFHCHILDHEDKGMMATVQVI